MEILPVCTSESNGQDRGRTRIADSCIAEDSLEKLATNPARITNAPASFAWGMGGVRAGMRSDAFLSAR